MALSATDPRFPVPDARLALLTGRKFGLFLAGVVDIAARHVTVTSVARSRPTFVHYKVGGARWPDVGSETV
ncbi:hypothetical protein ED733_005243 [Metarhizium rileyi]|uniref:Uncharacterized protein n=1 Tax=Metarhizium rileyi (strain RCEF 4871) TaxID=1649241 RepID=A0A5C6GGC3_METRR|nr:hypothetical protein ED733_005243 [Metarhizium rileyi]